MKKYFVIAGVIAFFILTFLIYHFISNSGVDETTVQAEKLQNDLYFTRKKLIREKNRLLSMTDELNSSFPLGATVQEQMEKASGLVAQTDFLFTDSSGSNPELIIQNLLSSIDINGERKNINLLIAEWKKRTSILEIETINIDESEKVLKETEIIKKFIEDLSKIVGALTTDNSDFSQLQIYTYSTQLPSVHAIDEIINSLQAAIDNNKIQTPTDYQPLTPPVSPNDVAVQQTVVTQTQAEITALEKQLAQIEPPPVVPPAPVDTTNNNQQNQNTNNFPTVYPYTPSTKGEIIIIQPGPPRLIQGTNQY